MSKEIESISSALFDKIRTRFEVVTLGDEKAQAVTDPEKARFFNFTYSDDDTDFGKVTISLIDEESLKVYYGLDITREMDRDQRTEWYNFLRNLRKFAKRNLLTFDTRDITKSNLSVQDVKQQTKADDVYSADEIQINESKMYGTSRSSFVECGTARLRIVHSEHIDPEVRGSRTRKINKIFVETDQGERFLLPFNNLPGARAMGEHINQGGSLTDERGQHIGQLVKEMAAMKHFVRSTKNRQFEDQETADMTEAAIQHYGRIKSSLNHMRGSRGYQSYFDAWRPEEDKKDDFDLHSLKERYAKKVFDDRFDEALPYVQKAYEQYRRQLGEYGSALGEWAEEVTESTWSKPDSVDKIQALRELLKQPLLLGIDGIDAKTKIEEIIGDDELNDKIEELASAAGSGPDADARPLIKQWLVQHMPQLMRDLEVGPKNSENASTNWAQPVSPNQNSTQFGAERPPGDIGAASPMTY